MSTRSLRRSAARRYLAFVPVVLPFGLALQAGCADTLNTYNSYYYVGETGEAGEGGEATGTAGAGGGSGSGGSSGQGGEAGHGPDDGHAAYPDAPYANTSVAEHAVDVFGVVGNRYWFAVSEEQLTELNGETGNGPIFDGPLNGDIYTPGGQTANFVDHLWVTTAGEDASIADYGKVQVKLAGQSTMRPWNKRSIPNFNIDSNEFVDKQRIGGFEHLRFNNGQVGSIFREYLTLELYKKLDYPAPLVTFAWVSSNVWGGDIEIPYVLVERYKRSFCARGDAFGGKCENMWEFAGDFGQKEDPNPGPLPPKPGGGNGPSVFDDPNNCQFSECDNTRVKELEQLLRETPDGEGFKAATEELIDWPAFHRFQCLSWVLATGDDALHNSNNVVLAERADGKFQFLPYSVDISLGQDWYPAVPLPGTSSIARGCQADKQCWADTVAACEEVLADFEEAKPIAMLDDLYELLDAEGMLRPGDEGRYDLLRAWFEERLEALPKELEENREGPVSCTGGLVDCGGFCAPPEQCGFQCKPPVGKAPVLMDGVGGAPGDEVPPPNECPMLTAYPL
jgi:CotH kinase protein